jgi:hypothetical protein
MGSRHAEAKKRNLPLPGAGWKPSEEESVRKAYALAALQLNVVIETLMTIKPRPWSTLNKLGPIAEDLKKWGRVQ